MIWIFNQPVEMKFFREFEFLFSFNYLCKFAKWKTIDICDNNNKSKLYEQIVIVIRLNPIEDTKKEILGENFHIFRIFFTEIQKTRIEGDKTDQWEELKY